MNAEPTFDAAVSFRLPSRPYPGLRPFEVGEWPIFFGRERMTEEVMASLIARRFIVVHGDSGCGKSSLIYAAVLPRLKQEAARGGWQWRTCSATPGNAPLDGLAAALARLDGSEGNEERFVGLRRVLQFGPDAAAALSASLRKGPDDHICILIDQFEELFAHARNHGPREAQLLVELLNGLQRREGEGIYVILTMRSEFLGACAQFQGFAEAVNATQYLLPQMGRNDLRRAISEPAKLFRSEIPYALAERLIDDASGERDPLPLIQHALMVLDKERVRAGRSSLELTDYTSTGKKLKELLSSHADEVAQRAIANLGMEKAMDTVVEPLFRELIAKNADGHAIRRARTFRQLIDATGVEESALRKVIDEFRADGVSFLRPFGREPLEPDDVVDVSHESLIRSWAKISDPKKGWLTREFESGHVWQSLVVQAERFEKNPARVLSPAMTEEWQAWLRDRNACWSKRYGGGWEKVRDLMSASVAAAEQQRDREKELLVAVEREQRQKLRNWSLAVVSVLAILAAALAWYGDRERREALEAHRQVTLKSIELEKALRVAEIQEKEREEALNSLMVSLQAVQNLVEQAPQADQLRNVEQTLAAQVNKASLGARIYLQISEPSQRDDARLLAARLKGVKFGEEQLTLPGIELGKTTRNALRCFRVEECRDEAPLLRDLINAQLASPKLVIDDFSRAYGSSSKIRPRHYEVWFAPGAITLTPEARTTVGYEK